ncbi:MAG TPA: hypothetical protein VIM79_27820 [Niastella sp.]
MNGNEKIYKPVNSSVTQLAAGKHAIALQDNRFKTVAQKKPVVQFQKPRSVEEMLADRIEKKPAAKTEIENHLTNAGKKLPTKKEKEYVLYADALKGGYNMLNNVNKPYLPFVKPTIQLIRSWIDVAKNKKKENGLKYFLGKYNEALLTKPEKIKDLLDYYKDETVKKGESQILAKAYLGLKDNQKDKSFNDSTIDPAFLKSSDTDLVKQEIHGGFYDPGGDFDLENKRANKMLDKTKGMSPIHRYYTIARYIKSNYEDLTDYKHRTVLILEKYLRDHLKHIIHIPPLQQANVDAVKLTNDVQYNNGNPVPHNSHIYTTIGTAWAHIIKAVAPAILLKAGQCAIRVRPRKSGLDYLFMRAWANGKEISIGETVTAGQIMHEYGHFLEDNGKTSRWLVLQQLLHERSTGKDLKSIFPVSIPGVISNKELQYDAAMPASSYTGGYFGYSAKHYEWGSTELVSTVLEVWNKPESIINIALADPDLFMAVLGVLRN